MLILANGNEVILENMLEIGRTDELHEGVNALRRQRIPAKDDTGTLCAGECWHIQYYPATIRKYSHTCRTNFLAGEELKKLGRFSLGMEDCHQGGSKKAGLFGVIVEPPDDLLFS